MPAAAGAATADDDAGHDLEGDAGGGERQGLLAAATEHERVAALEAHDAGGRRGRAGRAASLISSCGTGAPGALADVDQLGVGAGEREHAVPTSASWTTTSAASRRRRPADRQQVRVARARRRPARRRKPASRRTRRGDHHRARRWCWSPRRRGSAAHPRGDSAYGSATIGSLSDRRITARSFIASSSAAYAAERGQVVARLDRVDERPTDAGAVLEPPARAGLQRTVDHPADVPGRPTRRVGAMSPSTEHEHVAAGDVDVVGQLDGDRLAGRRADRRRGRSAAGRRSSTSGRSAAR